MQPANAIVWHSSCSRKQMEKAEKSFPSVQTPDRMKPCCDLVS